MYTSFMDFMNYTIFDIYIPAIRGTIILKEEKSNLKKAILAKILETSVILIAPILPYNSQDI